MKQFMSKGIIIFFAMENYRYFFFKYINLVVTNFVFRIRRSKELNTRFYV